MVQLLELEPSFQNYRWTYLTCYQTAGLAASLLDLLTKCSTLRCTELAPRRLGMLSDDCASHQTPGSESIDWTCHILATRRLWCSCRGAMGYHWLQTLRSPWCVHFWSISIMLSFWGKSMWCLSLSCCLRSEPPFPETSTCFWKKRADSVWQYPSRFSHWHQVLRSALLLE